MFEKEAEEYTEQWIVEEDVNDLMQEAYKDGAEFGYNKANDKIEALEERCEIANDEIIRLQKINEWHYVKDGDLPPKELEEKQLLVRVRNYTEDYIFAYYMLDKYYSKNGKRFYSDIGCDYPIDIDDIIAWKEIELPTTEN